MSSTESAGAGGTALNATVSTTPHDAEARRALLDLASKMEEGDAKNRILAMAETLVSPAETLLRLADEADQAVEDIKTKIKGMEETLKARQADAKDFRAQAKKLEG